MGITVFGEVIDQPLLVVSLVNAKTHVSIALFSSAIEYFMGLVLIHGFHFEAFKPSFQILIFGEEIYCVACKMGHFRITSLLFTLECTKLQKRLQFLLLNYGVDGIILLTLG